jgi:ATP-binding cassette subfamily B multidrug efflux pump
MIAFGWVTNLVQRGRASWERMLTILETIPSIADQGESQSLADVVHTASAPAIKGDIEFRNLRFTYGDSQVLDGISLKIAPGQTVAIVGRTGAGKSTLLALLARLHDPPPGTVFVDGIDVRKMPLATLRGAIGFVPQEPFLFSDTVAANVAFAGIRVEGVEGSEGVEGVSAIARLDADVAEFPNGYETRIGERGITLSGGQKQRTAIARALFADPRILVLDDALSAVDTHTEDEILHRLREFRAGRTTLIVSHRISTVRDADLIVVLNEGRIAEQGSHADLVARGGLYADLHRQQLLEAELAAS